MGVCEIKMASIDGVGLRGGLRSAVCDMLGKALANVYSFDLIIRYHELNWIFMNAGIHIYFLFVDRYHQLIANYEKKNVKQISNSTTLDSISDTEELEEGKKIQNEQVVFLVDFYLFGF